MFDFVLKACVHVICFALSFYALQALDFNRFLKKNHVAEAWTLYLMLSMAMGYLVANFILTITNLM